MKRQSFRLGSVLRYYELQKERSEYELHQASRVLKEIGKPVVKRQHHGTCRQFARSVPRIQQLGQTDASETPLGQYLHVLTKIARRDGRDRSGIVERVISENRHRP